MLRRLVVLLASLMAVSWPTTAGAQAGAVGKDVAVCVAPADRSLSAAQLLRAPAHFDCRSPQSRFGPGDFDVLSAPIAADVGTIWPAHVRYASLWQDRVTLYALYADGAIARLRLDGRGLSGALHLGAIVDQRLPFRHVAVTRLLWRVEGAANARGILVGARTARATDGWKSDLIMAAIYAAFGGLCIALLAYNMALWFALRHRFQLAYCTMLVTLMLYALSSSGALVWIWPAIANNDRIRLNYLTLAASAAAALSFARSFFERSVFSRWTGRAAHVVSAALIGSALVLIALAPWHLLWFDRLYSCVYVALVAIVVPVLVKAWRQRSNYLWLFAVAWALPIGFATLRTAANLGVIAWNFWIDNSTVLAMAAEALLSSVAIAYRINLLSRERDEAREQEVAARLLADTDPLTGLLNRRAFLAGAIGRGGDQILLVIDVDHFKRVNETIGHDGGDEVLRVVARALRAAVPAGALVARIGGEEFAIVADAPCPGMAAAVLDGLRAERMPFDVAVTASIGTCTGPLAREVDWKALYRHADRALFAAKAAGRDRARDAAALAVAA